MNTDNVVVVITTINNKTDAIRAYENNPYVSVLLIGDKKTPDLIDSANCRFVSVEAQNNLGFDVVKALPYNHYSRKNLGYLVAIQSGAEIIYDTDDDNLPLDDWCVPDFQSSLALNDTRKFTNIYKYFTKKKTWPRGLPLNCINEAGEQSTEETLMQDIGVWQGMANGDPDVDAIYRLIDNEAVIFEEKPSVYLNKGLYCPFNSQNTFWKKDFFSLLYLPSTTSFRFTDILRGYIAQRLIWEEGHSLGFMKATVFQDRNVHDYMRDFEDEVEVYLNVEKVVKILEDVSLSGSLSDKLKQIYVALAEVSIVKHEELEILDAWLLDYKSLQ